MFILIRYIKTLFETIKFYRNQFEKWGKLDSCCENLTTGYMCRYRWKKIRSINFSEEKVKSLRNNNCQILHLSLLTENNY